MRIWLMGASLPLLFVASSVSASPISGRVVDTQSHWAYGQTAIVTESVLERSDGSRVTVHQLGGSSEGIGMRISHGPQLLEMDDQVLLETEHTRTRAGRDLYQLRSILDLRRGPAPAGDKFDPIRDSVRTVNATGASIYWKSGCAILATASSGSSQIAGETEFEVIDQVLANWQGETRGCSQFELINDGLEDREVGLDGINLILFREQLWCRPATDDDPQECYDQAAAGITTLFFIDDADSSRNGEIIDADIEFNGVQFALSVGGSSNGASDCQADLANTLTHEVGHFLGLDHTCWTGGPRLVDATGAQIPACSGSLSSEIVEATMYNFQTCGETDKATLEPDDIAGMCAIYPAASHPGVCEPASITPKGCCSVAGQREDSDRGLAATALLWFFALLLLLRRRRYKTNL